MKKKLAICTLICICVVFSIALYYKPIKYNMNPDKVDINDPSWCKFFSIRTEKRNVLVTVYLKNIGINNYVDFVVVRENLFPFGIKAISNVLPSEYLIGYNLKHVSKKRNTNIALDTLLIACTFGGFYANMSSVISRYNSVNYLYKRTPAISFSIAYSKENQNFVLKEIEHKNCDCLNCGLFNFKPHEIQIESFKKSTFKIYNNCFNLTEYGGNSDKTF